MSGQDKTGQATVSFWFHFDWRLPSGAAAPFDVVRPGVGMHESELPAFLQRCGEAVSNVAGPLSAMLTGSFVRRDYGKRTLSG